LFTGVTATAAAANGVVAAVCVIESNGLVVLLVSGDQLDAVVVVVAKLVEFFGAFDYGIGGDGAVLLLVVVAVLVALERSAVVTGGECSECAVVDLIEMG
jgi:hypothetical protein